MTCYGAHTDQRSNDVRVSRLERINERRTQVESTTQCATPKPGVSQGVREATQVSCEEWGTSLTAAGSAVAQAAEKATMARESFMLDGFLECATGVKEVIEDRRLVVSSVLWQVGCY